MKANSNRVIVSTHILLTAVMLFFCAHASAFNECDFDENGIVDLQDFSVLSDSWCQALPWHPQCGSGQSSGDPNDNSYPGVIHVDKKSNSANPDGQKRSSAFKTIQQAIDAAEDNNKIHVWPGVYIESIDFLGKAIKVMSIADAAVITSPGDFAVTFYSAEQPDSILENFIIKGSAAAVSVSNSSPTLKNLTIVNNDYGIDLWGASSPLISNCILWDNQFNDIFTEAFEPLVTYSCIQRPLEGTGNVSIDPIFADPNAGDYHLKSTIGRYEADQSDPRQPKPENWVIDAHHSPCIDAGKPDISPMNETMPNGGRINIGAYGATPFASKSPWPLQADLNYNGQVWHDDLMIFIHNWLAAEPE